MGPRDWILGDSIMSLKSGRRIKVGSPDGLGPLSAGLVSKPVGTASVFGSDQPDLFVATGRGSSEPGVFLYRSVGRHKSGVPVFRKERKVHAPFLDELKQAELNLKILEAPDGTIQAFWLMGTRLTHLVYDPEDAALNESGRRTRLRLPGPAHSILPSIGQDHSVEILVGVSDGRPLKPTDHGSRDPGYRPFDGAGIWRGDLPYTCVYRFHLDERLERQMGKPTRVTPTEREALIALPGITAAELGPADPVFVAGSQLGQLLCYRPSGAGGSLERFWAVDRGGNMIRTPAVGACPVAYPSASGVRSDLIVGGEGCLQYYSFSEIEPVTGNPAYSEPGPVLEEDAEIYTGSLPVVNAVDWDGDGNLDIVLGNSEGRILFFRNAGGNEDPRFLPGSPIAANGCEIHIQAGYRGSVQGPQEARWGYACPTVVDWDGDGLPDLIMSDIRAVHQVYLNRGTKREPRLSGPRSLYCDGLELHGTWRVQPAVADMGGRTAYVMLDDDDEFHIFFKIDDFNLEDGGKLSLEDGSSIGANQLHAGGTGRLKLLLHDWDRDGRTDLLVGTPRHGSVPDRESGLPQSLGLPGAAVLLLRNVGSDQDPKFARPEVLRFKGKRVYFGHHACSPAVAEFREGVPDLIVGDQEGRLVYFGREDLSP